MNIKKIAVMTLFATIIILLISMTALYIFKQDDNLPELQKSNDSDHQTSLDRQDENVASDDIAASDDNTEPEDAAPTAINIQVVSDQKEEGNLGYEQAVNFVQHAQYNQALPLLVGKDDLLIKTQAMSGVLLARIYLATKQYVLAEQSVDYALSMHVGSEIELISLKAQALFLQEDYPAVVVLLSSRSPDLLSYPSYYTLLADAYVNLNQADNAVCIFQQIVAGFPDSEIYWLGLALAYQKAGDGSSAVVAYRRAAQLSADDPHVMLFINQQIHALQKS